MANDKRKTAAAAGVGLTAGAILALLLAQRAEAAPPPSKETVSLDEPAMQALISILEHTENLDADSDELIAIATQIAAALGAPTTLENPPDITAFRVLTTALDRPVQLPDRAVPYDMHLVIKAVHTNTGVIWVAPNQASAINPNSTYWLIANEAIEYEIRNADHIWINAPAFLGLGFAGDGVVCTVEQRR